MMTEILPAGNGGIVGSIGSAIGGLVVAHPASGGTAIQAAVAKFHFATEDLRTGGNMSQRGIVHHRGAENYEGGNQLDWCREPVPPGCNAMHKRVRRSPRRCGNEGINLTRTITWYLNYASTDRLGRSLE
ncbi:hypothetical protein [Escherichia coli]|uniref:hypothetical protein n=1 Tax=Escherichia coli TaxID=562 RepID=UPI00388E908D